MLGAHDSWRRGGCLGDPPVLLQLLHDALELLHGLGHLRCAAGGQQQEARMAWFGRCRAGRGVEQRACVLLAALRPPLSRAVAAAGAGAKGTAVHEGAQQGEVERLAACARARAHRRARMPPPPSWTWGQRGRHELGLGVAASKQCARCGAGVHQWVCVARHGRRASGGWGVAASPHSQSQHHLGSRQAGTNGGAGCWWACSSSLCGLRAAAPGRHPRPPAFAAAAAAARPCRRGV